MWVVELWYFGRVQLCFCLSRVNYFLVFHLPWYSTDHSWTLSKVLNLKPKFMTFLCNCLLIQSSFRTVQASRREESPPESSAFLFCPFLMFRSQQFLFYSSSPKSLTVLYLDGGFSYCTWTLFPSQFVSSSELFCLFGASVCPSSNLPGCHFRIAPSPWKHYCQRSCSRCTWQYLGVLRFVRFGFPLCFESGRKIILWQLILDFGWCRWRIPSKHGHNCLLPRVNFYWW